MAHVRRMSLPLGALGIYLLWSAQGCTVKDPGVAGSGGSDGSTAGTTSPTTGTTASTSSTTDIDLTTGITTAVETTAVETTGETEEEPPEEMLVTTLPPDFTAAPTEAVSRSWGLWTRSKF